MNVQESDAVPEALTLVGVNVHAVLLLVRLTVNGPFNSFTVIVELAAVPALTAMLVGLAVRLKSRTVKVTWAVCDKPPLVPVTVTVVT